jgi:hypothetical protein
MLWNSIVSLNKIQRRLLNNILPSFQGYAYKIMSTMKQSLQKMKVMRINAGGNKHECKYDGTEPGTVGTDYMRRRDGNGNTVPR